MKYVKWLLLICVAAFLLSVVMGTCNTAVKMNDNLQKTVYEEFKPEELLKKYEWFKEASAGLDQKLATLKVYEERFLSIKVSYGKDSTNRAVWSRTDQEQWNIWQSEYIGLKSSYNQLASEYNAAMVKFNYRFCNTGDLPKGAETALPREFKPYLNS